MPPGRPDSAASRPTRSPWRLRALTLLLALLACIALGEGFLRLLRPPQLSVVRYPCVYRPDDAFGFRYEPGGTGVIAGHFEFENQVVMNSLGFYDEEPGPANATPRILAVGDSFTAAMNLPKPSVWTSVLERELHARGHPGADVVNLGLDGTGTDVHLAVIREYVPRFRPDVVVLAFYANDVGDVAHGRFQRECHRGYVVSYQTLAQRDALRAQVDAHLAKPVRIWWFEHSYWVRLWVALTQPQRNPYRVEFVQPRLADLDPEARDGRAGAARFREAVYGLNRVAETCDCLLLVVPVPPRKAADGSLELWNGYARNARLPLLDLLPALERAREARGLRHEELFFPNDNHLNALGNELFGRALAEALVARGW